VGADGRLGVAPMDVQNALIKEALRSFAQRTLMTANLTQFTMTSTFSSHQRRQAPCTSASACAARRHIRKSGLPLPAFLKGDGLGAFATKSYRFLGHRSAHGRRCGFESHCARSFTEKARLARPACPRPLTLSSYLCTVFIRQAVVLRSLAAYERVNRA